MCAVEVSSILKKRDWNEPKNLKLEYILFNTDKDEQNI